MGLNKNDYGRDGKLRRSGLEKLALEMIDSRFRKIEKDEKLKEKHEFTSDSKLRITIQKEIHAMVLEGKGKIEILSYLNNKYGDTYLSKYFESYIDNKFRYLKKDNKIDFER